MVLSYQFLGKIMLKKVCVGLIVLIALVHGLAGSLGDAMDGVLMLLLALSGLVYAAVAIDAEDATAFLVVTVAVGLAADANVLSNIHVVGEYLDAILDAVPIALYSGVATILAVRAYNRLKG